MSNTYYTSFHDYNNYSIIYRKKITSCLLYFVARLPTLKLYLKYVFYFKKHITHHIVEILILIIYGYNYLYMTLFLNAHIITIGFTARYCSWGKNDISKYNFIAKSTTFVGVKNIITPIRHIPLYIIRILQWYKNAFFKYFRRIFFYIICYLYTQISMYW